MKQNSETLLAVPIKDDESFESSVSLLTAWAPRSSPRGTISRCQDKTKDEARHRGGQRLP